MTVPSGHLLVGIGLKEVGATVVPRTFAVPLEGGGEPVELPEPAFRPGGPGAIEG